MNRSDLLYDLPAERIAQFAVEPRDSARMLVLHRSDGQIEDRRISDLPEYMLPGDILLTNDSRVVPARLLGYRVPSGGQVEVLLLRPETSPEGPALVRCRTRQREGMQVALEPDGPPLLEILSETEEGSRLVRSLDGTSLLDLARRYGHIPLPPYIKREDVPSDRDRYQTIWADREGSVAAPTAGLHFTLELLERLLEKGVLHRKVTLHVGWGTFRPIEVEDLEQHQMFAEWFDVPPPVSQAIESLRSRGGRLLAVGTTSVRAIESAYRDPARPIPSGETRLFIRPPYTFRVVDRLLTNFHAPGSSLLALVSAFATPELIRKAYTHALAGEYRFLSYGDAMLIL